MYFRRNSQSLTLAIYSDDAGREIACHVNEAEAFEHETGISLDADVINSATFAKLASFLS